MILPEKQEGKYILCCVLVNGEEDPEQFKDCRDQLYKEKEIKQIATTEANNTNFDVYHEKQKVEGAKVIFNYLNDVPVTLDGVTVPPKSFMKLLHVTNQDILDKINKGEINGVSPTLKVDKETDECICNQKLPVGEILYSDVDNKECFLPIWLSLVENPCNNVPLKIYDDYESYLDNKNNIRVDKMTTENENKSKLSEAVEAVKAGFNLAKESSVDNSEEKKEETVDNSEETTSSVDEIKEVVQELIRPVMEEIEKIKSDVSDLKEAIETDVENEEESDEEKKKKEDEEDDSEVNNSDNPLMKKLNAIEEKLGLKNESEVNNSGKKPLPKITKDVGKDVSESEVNNNDNEPKDRFGQNATDYREA